MVTRDPVSMGARAEGREDPPHHVEPDALRGIQGGSLFYPGSGRDCLQPLALFAGVLEDFWFVDRSYFTREPADRARPLGPEGLGFRHLERRIDGVPLASRESRTDPETGRRYPFIEPCIRTDSYVHRETGRVIRVHRRRGFGQRSIRLLDRIAVFWHRADSPGEGGSGVWWLSDRWKDEILSRLQDGGLVVTDGSLALLEPLTRLRERTSSPSAFRAAKGFEAWGRQWTPVGWADARIRPTVVWRLDRVVTAP